MSDREIDSLELIGRDDVLRRLLAASESARGGQGRLVMLSGEAGIGKTALAQVVAQTCARSRFMVGWGIGWDGEGAPPFWPWVEVLRSLLSQLDDEERGALGPATSQLAPLLAGLDAAPVFGDDSDRAQFRLYDAVCWFLMRLGDRRPILVVLDDLQWADPSTLRLTRFVAARANRAPILILAAYRDTEVGPEQPVSRSLHELEAIAEVLPITGLDGPGVALLLGQVTGAVDVDADVAEQAWRRTGGNPFFVRELGQLLRGQSDHALAGAPISGGVRTVIERRLARLSQPCHQLLTVAAVLGQDVHRGLLIGVSGVDAARAADLLVEAERGRIIAPQIGELDRVRFAHDLFRETLYDAIPVPRRSELHRRAGACLEARMGAGGDVNAAELAHHFLRTGTDEDRVLAARYCLAAARDALARLASRDAVEHAGRAVAAINEARQPDGDLRMDALLVLAEAERRAGEGERARADFLNAASLARRRGRPDALGWAALGAHRVAEEYALTHAGTQALLAEAVERSGEMRSALRARLLAGLARQRYHDRSGDRDEVRAMAGEAVAAATAAGDQPALAFALFAQHDTMWFPGTAAARLEIATEMEEAAAGAGDPELRAEAGLLRAVARLELCDPTAAAELEDYCTLAADLREPRGQYLALTRQVTLATLQGRLDAAEAMREEASLLGQAINEPDKWNVETRELWALRTLQGRRRELETRVRSWTRPIVTAWYVAQTALCLVEAGTPVEAAAVLRQLDSFDPAEQSFDNLWLSQVTMVAEAAAAVGDQALAERVHDALLPYAGLGVVTAGAVEYSGVVDHYLGLVAACLGRLPAAADHLARASELHRQIGSPPWLTRSEAARSQLPAAGARVAWRPAAEESDGPPPKSDGTFRRDGDVWTLSFAGTVVRMKDAKGLRDIATLLAAPGRSVLAADLLTSTDPTAGEFADTRLGADPVLDDRARAAYRARLHDLDEDLADAEANNDLERMAHARLERELLAEELAAAVGLGGRTRLLGAGPERARKAVTARIRNSITRIQQRHPDLGAHLAESITTGTTCSYLPDRPVVWQL